MRKALLFVLLPVLSLITGYKALAQADSTSDLENELNSGTKAKPRYVASTFKATRIVNAYTVENLGKGILDFRIEHRFGQVNQGAQNFFGLDNATTRLGFDYGITNWLMVGIGHNTFDKEDDGFVKIRLLRQKEKGGGMPITVSYVSSISIQTGTPSITIPQGDTYHFSDRLYFANQVLIARKFNDWLSLQLMPALVHSNLVDSSKYSNDLFALGAGGRIKLSNRFALTGEYYYVFTKDRPDGYHNTLAVGVDIETGGHVFQLHFTNSTGMTDRTVIGETTDSWSKGELHFGFNISRVFTLAKPKEFKNSRNKIW
jgi:hypothetical protein